MIDKDKFSDKTITAVNIEFSENIFGISYTQDERSLMVDILEHQLEISCRRRMAELKNSDPPSLVFRPYPPSYAPRIWNGPTFLPLTSLPLPTSDTDIAFAPMHHQITWLRSQQLSSRRLTEIYLDRIDRFSGILECMVTITADTALRQADNADAQFEEGTI